MIERPPWLRVQHRDHSSGYRFYEGGRVEIVQWRRVTRAEAAGGWEEVVVSGDSIEEAEAALHTEQLRRLEVATRQAARRAKWGPSEIARPA